uniref:(northern house mosquito) hypothetical protein n=1 Tax=Culex pipiens TaxID=7175 RepID=A0A8D8GXZ8_CULPI
MTLALSPPRVNEPRVETLGDVWFELRWDVDHREKPVWPPVWLCADGLSMTGLRSDRCEPSELSEVVFELRPVHRPTSELRLRRIPVPAQVPGGAPPACGALGLFGTTPSLPVEYCLYQSGMLSRCRDAWTRSWCSLRLVPVSCDFWSSFSGGKTFR